MKDLELKDKLMGISRKYAEMALNEVRVDLVSKYMSIAERALSMARKLRSDEVTEVDPVFRFGSYIVEPTPRSVVYDKYLEFCDALKIDHMSRNTFYDRLRDIGFKDIRRTDNSYFLPPSKYVGGRKRVQQELTLDEYIADLKHI